MHGLIWIPPPVPDLKDISVYPKLHIRILPLFIKFSICRWLYPSAFRMCKVLQIIISYLTADLRYRKIGFTQQELCLFHPDIDQIFCKAFSLRFLKQNTWTKPNSGLPAHFLKGDGITIMILYIFLCLSYRTYCVIFISFSLLLQVFFLEIHKASENLFCFSTLSTLFPKIVKHFCSTLDLDAGSKNIRSTI